MKYITSLLLAGSLVATAEESEAEKAKLVADGTAVFPSCIACHGSDGKGMKPAPTMVFAPTLVDSKLALGDPEVFAQIVMKGIQKEGTEYMMIMAPLEAALDDAKLSAVLTYVRNSFGNKGTAITADQVKEWRANHKDRKKPYTRAELAEFTKKSEEAAKKAE